MSGQTPFDRLAGNPWFQLSTAGQELFHSNMLYWLAKYRWTESRPVWELLAPTLADRKDPPQVLREKRHIDLTLRGKKDESFLVLENKTSAVPSRKQLEKYQDDLRKKGFEGHGHWVLLSLIEPASLPGPWEHVSYDKLGLALERVSLDDEDAALLKGYRGLVAGLIQLSRDWLIHDEPAFVAQRFSYEKSAWDAMAEARMLTLVQKLRMSRFARIVQDRLSEGYPEVVPGLTRGLGLAEFFCDGADGIQFGWQIQGQQFRLAARTVKVGDEKKAATSALEDIKQGHNIFSGYFEAPECLAGLLPNGSDFMKTRSEFCTFGDEFIYKYKIIPESFGFARVIEIARQMAEYAVVFCDGLRRERVS